MILNAKFMSCFSASGGFAGGPPDPSTLPPTSASYQPQQKTDCIRKFKRFNEHIDLSRYVNF